MKISKLVSNNPKSKRIIATTAVLFIVAMIIIKIIHEHDEGLAASNQLNDSNASASPTISPSLSPTAEPTITVTPIATIAPTPTPTPIPAQTQAYKDGTYTAIGSYTSPGGADEITVTVTLKNGVISTTSAKPGASNRESAAYEADFIDAYPVYVIGKNISTLNLSRVAGASLTSRGFNNAIIKIRVQAKT